MKSIANFGVFALCMLILTSCNVKNGETKIQKSNEDLQIGNCFIAEVNGSSNKICFRIIGDSFVEVYRKSPFENLQEEIDGYKSINYRGEIIIPETVKYDDNVFTVTKIGDYAFFCTDITSVIIPKSAISIGESSFQACNKLKNVTIPESVVSIGQYAFTGCTSIVFIESPNSVKDIGEFAFKYCDNLLSITIPSSMDSLKEGVFHGCINLTSLIIKEGLKYIGDSAFEECTNLTHISIPNSVMGIGLDAFARCSMLSSVDIQNPELKMDYDNVFSGCDRLNKRTMTLMNTSKPRSNITSTPNNTPASK